MNAPDKLYIDSREHWRKSWTAFTTKAKGDDIEYIRKDVFVEKALDYIENNIYDHYDGDNEYGICGGYVKKEEFVEKFINYMKRE